MGKVAASLWKASCKPRTGRSRWTTRTPLHTSFPVFQHSRGFSNETRDRRSVKNVCAIWQAHGQFLKQAHRGRVLLYLTSVISHNTECILIMHMCQRFAFGVNALLSSSIKTIKRRPVKLSTPVSLFPSSPFFAENCASLHILGRWKCCSTTLCLFLPVDRAKATVLARTRKLCGGIPRLAANRKAHLFFCLFFSVIGENQCGRKTRNTEKNLHGLTWM